MYDPSALTPDVWAKYTRALTDCNSKTEEYVATRGGGSPYSTDQVYEYLLDPKGNDIHHFILQYLEEGTIDLVCLSTDLEMEHCDVMRDSANAIKGNYLVQLIKNPILRIPNFNFPNLRCCNVFLSF